MVSDIKAHDAKLATAKLIKKIETCKEKFVFFLLSK
jgi:hypothetical protein